jgi:hypothetical protein
MEKRIGNKTTKSKKRRDFYSNLFAIVIEGAIVAFFSLVLAPIIILILPFGLPNETGRAFVNYFIDVSSLGIFFRMIVPIFSLAGLLARLVTRTDVNTSAQRFFKVLFKTCFFLLIGATGFNYGVIVTEQGARTLFYENPPPVIMDYRQHFVVLPELPPEPPFEPESPPEPFPCPEPLTAQLLPLLLTPLDFYPAESFSSANDSLEHVLLNVERAILGLRNTPFEDERTLNSSYASRVQRAAQEESDARAYFNEYVFRGMRHPLCPEAAEIHETYKAVLLESYSRRREAGNYTRTFLNEMEMANYQRSLGDINIRLGIPGEAFDAFELAREHYVVALQLSLSRPTGRNDAIRVLEGLIALYGDRCFLDEEIRDITLSFGVTLEQMRQTEEFLRHLLQAVDRFEFS